MRRVADFFHQVINEESDFRGQDIRFRIDEPQGRPVVDLVVGQDTDQRAVGEFAAPHPDALDPDALDPQKSREIVRDIETILGTITQSSG